MDDLIIKIIIIVVAIGLGVLAAVIIPDKEQDEIIESMGRFDHELLKFIGIITDDESEEYKMKDEYFLKIEHYMDGKKVWTDRAELYKDEYNSLIEFLEDNIHTCDITPDETIKEEHERLERCRDCVCLVAGDDGEWICDEAEDECAKVKYCPEGM